MSFASCVKKKINIKTDSGWGNGEKRVKKKRRQYSAASLLNQIKWYKKKRKSRTHARAHTKAFPSL